MRLVWRVVLLGGMAVGSLLGLTACLGFSPLRAVIKADVTQGEAPLSVLFDLSGSSGGVTGFLLDFGDGRAYRGEDVNVPIAHIYEDPGTYTAILTVWNATGRQNTDSLDIVVDYPPLAASLRADVTQGFVPLSVSFDLSHSEGAIVAWSLDFGDGTVRSSEEGLSPAATEILQEPVDYVYTKVGTYRAVLTVRDRWDRIASDEVEITVHPSYLRAVLNASPQTGYAPLQVTFDLSKSLGEIQGFTLDFGDGESLEGLPAQLANPVYHTYRDPGTYTATLTVRDVHGAEDSQSVVINVLYPPLDAVISAQPTSGTAPLEVTFDISRSIGPIMYFILDFGDGDVVNGLDITYAIVHTYTQPGNYTATLTVIDIYGRSDAATVAVQVQ